PFVSVDAAEACSSLFAGSSRAIARSAGVRQVPRAVYGHVRRGLRIGEAARLKTTSIDSERHVLRVTDAKGHKERLVMLPDRLLLILRAYWAQERPPLP